LPTEGSDRRTRRRPAVSAPALTVAASAFAAVVFLATQARRLYFFGDDWEFLLHRQLNWDDLMRPHNEHWSALPVVAFRTMVAIFGIDHYLAFAFMSIMLHVLCASLLYLLMRTSGIRGWPAAVLVVPFLFLCGNTGENPLWDFQIGFLGSAALGLLALLLNYEPVRLRLILGWVASVLSFMCSGMALPMLMWLGIYVLLRRGVVRALVATVPPALVYLAWYVQWGRHATAQSPDATLALIVEFAWTGIAGIWQAVLRLPGTGGVAFIVLVLVGLFGCRRADERALALSGVLTTVASYFLLGLSRAGLGVDASLASRYFYFGLLFTIPAAAVGLSLLADRLRPRGLELVIAGAVVAGLLVANGIGQTVAFADGRSTLTDPIKPRILASEQLADRGETFLNQYPLLPYEPDITVDALSRPEIRDQLPDQPVTPRQLLSASAVLQVAAAPDSFDLPPATGLGTHNIKGTLDPSGCATMHADQQAWIDLPPSSTGSEVNLSSRVGSYPGQLIDGRLVSDPVELTATPGAPTYIGTTASTGTLRLTIKPGPLKVCLSSTGE
jgi:hypothetical protein